MNLHVKSRDQETHQHITLYGIELKSLTMRHVALSRVYFTLRIICVYREYFSILLQSLSDSHIMITSTEFISGTSNVITTSKITEPAITTLYESIQLRLHTIQPAESAPPMVSEAESASIFIGRWLFDDTPDDTD